MNLALESIAMVGLGCVVGGVYILGGLGPSLIASGLLLFAVSVLVRVTR